MNDAVKIRQARCYAKITYIATTPLRYVQHELIGNIVHALFLHIPGRHNLGKVCLECIQIQLFRKVSYLGQCYIHQANGFPAPCHILHYIQVGVQASRAQRLDINCR